MRNISWLVVSAVVSGNVFAAETAAPAKTGTEYEYPELLVAPSASERLSQEAKAEAKENWQTHWAIQSSAALTIFAGVLASSDPGKKDDLEDGEVAMTKTASLAAYSIGGGWLAITGILSATYSPYRSGLKSMSGMSRGNNKRDQLAYERSAEEALYRPARIASVMKWTSVLSNVVAGGLVLGSAKNNMTKIAGGLAVIGGFFPLMFEHPWEESYRFHENYKKRIYGPLAYQRVSIVPHNDQLAAAWTVGVEF